ncbi:hypothetical protein CDEST_01331 [Colletotrichum destructivum]|uniref:Uncharacterized protein n=1 Tax=Colletotrichum destructivum TaxID=34406 RepID=A0AAX4HYS5_9PEZI|nr:hypothetical protein CDEST_01331 [Colletotrichum destructivum]
MSQPSTRPSTLVGSLLLVIVFTLEVLAGRGPQGSLLRPRAKRRIRHPVNLAPTATRTHAATRNLDESHEHTAVAAFRPRTRLPCGLFPAAAGTLASEETSHSIRHGTRNLAACRLGRCLILSSSTPQHLANNGGALFYDAERTRSGGASYSFPHLTSALSGDSLSGPAPANEACRHRIICLTTAKPPAAAANHRPLQATPQQDVVHRGISGGGGGTPDAMPSANGFWNPVIHRLCGSRGPISARPTTLNPPRKVRHAAISPSAQLGGAVPLRLKEGRGRGGVGSKSRPSTNRHSVRSWLEEKPATGMPGSSTFRRRQPSAPRGSTPAFGECGRLGYTRSCRGLLQALSKTASLLVLASAPHRP